MAVRKPILLILSIALAFTLIMGCGSRRLVGSPIVKQNLPKLQVGKTTRGEIFALFGAPFRVERQGDREVLTYLYGQESTWTIGFYTERTEQADLLTIYIEKNNIVSDFAYSEGVSIPEMYRTPLVPRP